MGFIQKGVSMEQIQRTGEKIAVFCLIAEKLFKENELNDFLRYININESIPMATKEFQAMLSLGPVATKRARAVGDFIKVSKETWDKDSKAQETPTGIVAAALLKIIADMEIEDAEEPKQTQT